MERGADHGQAARCPNEGRGVRWVEDPSQVDWDVEVDVLVIGAGGCGLVAALAAAQAGAEVLVIEKEKEAGGNTALSQAMVPAAGSREQRAAGVEDSPESMAEDILRKNQWGSDPALTLHVARESARLIDWLRDDLGIELNLVTDFLYPGHSAHRIHANRSRKGKQLVQDLLQATRRFAGIHIAYKAAARRLVALRSDGGVLGAEVEISGVGMNLARARRVILALNGFGANRELLRRFIPEMSEAYYFGHEGNTGEAIIWGEELGAQLDNMGAYQAHGSVAYPHGTLVTWAVISLGGFQVNLEGRRFVNEYHGYSEHALDVLAQPEGLAVEIFDQRILDVVKDYEDMQQCLHMGAVRRFADLAELARAFSLPWETLAATFRQFQAAARGECLDPLGRTVFGPPLMPPYYGVKVTGALFHTQGGLRVDERARVVRTDGSLIPRLYAGGGSAAGFSGRSGPSGYLSANGLMAALILGMIAGEDAGYAVRLETLR
ncbi:MAG: FAD-dependent oxidoreductase [Desulfomicrobiaceae bacterium]|nr:FAD-dependent oxidoreductase [Desulfomicrobiaceae bacterium]